MLKNYLTIAIRNIARHKVYSFINIIGLSVGVGVVILMALFVKEEWTYDEDMLLWTLVSRKGNKWK